MYSGLWFNFSSAAALQMAQLVNIAISIAKTNHQT